MKTNSEKHKNLLVYLNDLNRNSSSVCSALAILNVNKEYFSKIYPNLNFDLAEKLENHLFRAARFDRRSFENCLAFLEAKRFLIETYLKCCSAQESSVEVAHGQSHAIE